MSNSNDKLLFLNLTEESERYPYTPAISDLSSWNDNKQMIFLKKNIPSPRSPLSLRKTPIKINTDFNEKTNDSLHVNYLVFSPAESSAYNPTPKMRKTTPMKFSLKKEDCEGFLIAKCNCIAVGKLPENDLISLSFSGSCGSPNCINKNKVEIIQRRTKKLKTKSLERKNTNQTDLNKQSRTMKLRKKLIELNKSVSPKNVVISIETTKKNDFSKSSSMRKAFSSNVRLPYIRVKPIFHLGTSIRRDYHNLSMIN
ncbi:unnamed protein product [Blepharisma stoltei]|uniref:Uncharacterized protein n=1 Tax=Blepharisma stoltei TaxID=1481888 RepID=A0AAU9IIC3_9CILI|nr:unnamed protein product [Blepharisma stoltei]